MNGGKLRSYQYNSLTKLRHTILITLDNFEIIIVIKFFEPSDKLVKNPCFNESRHILHCHQLWTNLSYKSLELSQKRPSSVTMRNLLVVF